MKGVMCCGCYRMMAPDGKPLTAMRPGTHSPELIREEVSPDDIAWFATKEECDEAAKGFGWSTEDREGPNHRCPDCLAAETTEDQSNRRGAYIDREDLGL